MSPMSPPDTFDYVLYSDGGGERMKSAAGGCIVEDTVNGTTQFYAVFLGGATNNEAEIMAALVGFTLLRVRRQTPKTVRWVSDSEYVLKSGSTYIHEWRRNGWRTAARTPVKNQGLWHAFSALTSDLSLATLHVRGHSGHPENEACDEISVWLQARGEELIADERDRAVAEGDLRGNTVHWQVIDGREFLARVRENPLDHGALDLLIQQVASREKAPGTGGLRAAVGKSGENAEDRSALHPALEFVRKAKTTAEQIRPASRTAVSLVDALGRLLKKFE